MRVSETVSCLDKYEKEKLCRLFSVQKNGKIAVIDIINIIENELIILLYDKSCHSVTMEDNDSALKLFNLFKGIKDGTREFVELQESPLNNVLVVTNFIRTVK